MFTVTGKAGNRVNPMRINRPAAIRRYKYPIKMRRAERFLEPIMRNAGGSRKSTTAMDTIKMRMDSVFCRRTASR
ncbi:hypothetical protein D1872_252080 [compost metagenome]